ncbi:FAD-dependent oxidoreductase [Roseovarius sp. EL26]|uniref:flavin monoamine oxidase family protein n=1 Tax=Roseovarius sp. EL26 TaxID=2126672 RepID=UPI000EA3CD1C|nr:FAD-dependent oxidoreductase [Roseovarius sp. EL26]
MKTDVLIVGGGLSGLALADRLTKAGTDFLVVEAQDRLGGRILSENLSDGMFDLGPAWFWPGQPRMAQMVQRFSLPVFEQYTKGDLMYQDQTGVIQRGHGYASMQGSYRIDGGMIRLINALADTLEASKILQETTVRALRFDGKKITANLTHYGEPTTIHANRVVLAVPPRVAAKTITFEPKLGSEQTRAMEKIPTWMAGQAKIIAVYDAPYWRNAGLSGDAMSRRGPMVEIHDASPMEGGPYALFGFVGILPDAREAHKEEMIELALAQFSALFGNALANPLDIMIKDWATAPQVATSQDRIAPENHPTYGLPHHLKDIWGGAIHLTSTETAHGFGGLLEGALEAAETSAQHLSCHNADVV